MVYEIIRNSRIFKTDYTNVELIPIDLYIQFTVGISTTTSSVAIGIVLLKATVLSVPSHPPRSPLTVPDRILKYYSLYNARLFRLVVRFYSSGSIARNKLHRSKKKFERSEQLEKTTLYPLCAGRTAPRPEKITICHS